MRKVTLYLPFYIYTGTLYEIQINKLQSCVQNKYTNEGRLTSYLYEKIYIFLIFARYSNIINSDLYLVHLVKVYNSLCHKIFKDVNGS